MKKIVFTFLIFTLQSAFANYVPSQFIEETSHTNKAMTTLDSLTPTIESVLNTESEILEKRTTSGSKFKLNTMGTDFAITRGGLFGLSALKAKSAVTMFWGRKNKSNSQKDNENKIEKVVELEGPQSESDLNLTAEELTETLYQTGKVNNKEALLKNLKYVMKNANISFGIINDSSFGKWEVGGLRLDLNISASGVITPFTKVGGSVRVWIEWKKVAQNNSGYIITSRSGKKLRKFVNLLMSDLHYSTNNLSINKYNLKAIYVGLGQDIKTGFFGLGNSSLGFVGFVKFVKKKVPSTNNKSVELADNLETDPYLPTIQESNSNDKNRFTSFFLPRRKLRANLARSLSFGKFMLSKTERIKSKSWEIKKLRLVTALNKSGFLGLSTLSTKGVIIFIFAK